MADGKSRLEALRCLKRHLADVIYRTMIADANATSRLDDIGALDREQLVLVPEMRDHSS